MLKKFSSNLPQIAALLFVGAFAFFGFLNQKSEPVRASASDNVSGWAWSENIGWISFDSTNAQVNTFVKTIGGVKQDSVGQIQQTSDGGYIAAGYTQSYGSGGDDLFVFKLDSSGNLSWAKTIATGSSVLSSIPYSVQQTSDGGYVVAGIARSFEEGHIGMEEVLIVKLDSLGNINPSGWAKTIAWTDIPWSNVGYLVTSVQQALDGGYILAGYTTVYDSYFGGTFIVKLKADGSFDWAKTLGGANEISSAHVQQTSDGGYIATAYTFRGGGYTDFSISKLDAAGVRSWTSSILATNMEHLNSIKQTSDGGYIAAGYAYSSGNALIIKFKADGSFDWEKIIQGASFNSVQQTSDGGYIAAGDLGLIIKFDSNGSFSWEKIINGAFFNSVQQTSDGGYIAAGSTQSYGAGMTDAFVVKLDSLGNSSNCSLITASSPIILPASPSVSNPAPYVLDLLPTVLDATPDMSSPSPSIATQCSASAGSAIDYGVKVDLSTGNFSGYAWSDNIGWISFNQTDTGAPPSDDPCGADCIAEASPSGQLGNGNVYVSGWARALSYGSGWDGWMRFDHGQSNPVYIDQDGDFHGWAWGSDVVGWVSFNSSDTGAGGSAYKVVLDLNPNQPPDKPATFEVSWDRCSFQGGAVPILSWTYSDPDNVPLGADPQTAYEVEVDENSSFNAPKFNHLVSIPSTSYVLDLRDDDENPDDLPASMQDYQLDWNSTYFWRVRVKDSQGNWSQWSNPSQSKTDKHASPWVVFSFTPAEPTQGEVVDFTDQSETPSGVAIVSWLWTITQGTGVFVDSVPTDADPHIKFLTPDNKIKLEVTDSDGYSCESAERYIFVQLPLPEYKEIPPVFWFRKFLASIAGFLEGIL